jgi:hypothetical protein
MKLLKEKILDHKFIARRKKPSSVDILKTRKQKEINKMFCHFFFFFA